MTRWQQQMTEVALELLLAFAEALNLPHNAFDNLYGDYPNEHIKVIRYPGRTAGVAADPMPHAEILEDVKTLGSGSRVITEAGIWGAAAIAGAVARGDVGKQEGEQAITAMVVVLVAVSRASGLD